MIQMIKMEHCLIQKVELFTMVSKIAEIAGWNHMGFHFSLH